MGTTVEGNRKPKDQDSVFIQSNKMRRRRAGALASIPVRKIPARSQKKQPYTVHQTGINTNPRNETGRYKYTIHSVREPICKSHQLTSGITLRIRSLVTPSSIKETTVYQMIKFKPELLNCTNDQISKPSFFCNISCKQLASVTFTKCTFM